MLLLVTTDKHKFTPPGLHVKKFVKLMTQMFITQHGVNIMKYKNNG